MRCYPNDDRSLAMPVDSATASEDWGKHPMAVTGFACLSCRVMNENQNVIAGKPARTCPYFPANSPHRILVVEDDDDVRRFNVEVLTRCGFKVDAAEDGAAAWDTLQTNYYDLMVTDNNMPKISGVDLLKKLHAAHLALPVIMATGATPQEEFSRCPWLLPAAMLLKPYTIEQLLGTVKNVLRATAAVNEPSVPVPGLQNQSPTGG